MLWNPSQYLKFADHRLRPAIDLLNQISVDAPSVVYDLGCGAGNVTQLLAQRWPGARVVGVDNSPEMLARAAANWPGLEWELADFGTWRPDGPAELIYSNSALHWVTGHGELFTGLMSSLAPGGVLAVQMPRNFGARSHTSISEAAINGPWRKRLEPLLRPAPVQEPAFYIDVLAPLASSLDVWETEYMQVLTGDDPVKEWTKGTWLKPLLDALEEPERSQFEAAYAALVAEAYPRRPDGTTIFPFKRMFVVARRD
ncbi:MAG: methyltransferase domain-containing protein [Chloroflexi bacterium]|nr:methyltransferase domain-containing protein [Chloroflexota bacterium]